MKEPVPSLSFCQTAIRIIIFTSSTLNPLQGLLQIETESQTTVWMMLQSILKPMIISHARSLSAFINSITLGDTWYGTEERFGIAAPTYTSEDLLEFYNNGQSWVGKTIELRPVTNGNLDRTKIPGSEFPKG